MDELNKDKKKGEIDYVPEVIDIEGLQGMNSSQGMENFQGLEDYMNYPKYDVQNDSPYYNEGYMYASQPPDNMYNPPTMSPVYGGGKSGYYDGTCAQLISCMAQVCYMMSVYLTQMLQMDMSMKGPEFYQPVMDECDCMHSGDEFHGYPPIY